MRDKIPFIIFFISCLVVAWFVGFMTHERNWFPKDALMTAKVVQNDWRKHWKTYFGIAPTKFMRPSFNEGEGVTVNDKAQVAPGLTFLTGFFQGNPGMALISPSGKFLHVWPARFFETWKTTDHIKMKADIPVNDWSAYVHGAQPMPDGSVIFNFANLGLVRESWCGEVMWKLPYPVHHSIHMADDGNLWIPGHKTYEGADGPVDFLSPPYLDQMLLKVTPEGKIIKEVSLLKSLVDAGLIGEIFPVGVRKHKGDKIVISNLLHLNDIEPLSASMADQYPLFEAGDLLVSMRNINMLAVLDGKTFAVKWHKTGPWLRQHDPDFIGDGKIAVFDNVDDGTLTGNILGGSRIMIVDPVTRKTVTYFAGSKKLSFYTKYMGKEQFLKNGNVLITEPVRGRVFEISPAGKLVWEFISRFDKNNVLMVQEGTRYPENYFKVKKWDCAGKDNG